MNSSSNIEKIYLIWLAKDVDNEKNKSYQNELRKTYPKLELVCVNQMYLVFEILMQINFKKVILLIDGELYSEFYKKFKSGLYLLAVVPKIVIFTPNEMKLREKYGASLPLNHSFYNSHGVVGNFQYLKKELLSHISFDDNMTMPENDILERNKENNEKFIFECVKEKNQLIIPLFFSYYINSPDEEQIQSFNKFMLNNFGKNKQISDLISQLNGVKNIPIEILSKFWIRAYTANSNFYKKMNEKLMENDVKEYMSYIQVLYEGIKKKSLEAKCNTKLYRGAILSKKEYIQLNKFITEKPKDLPGVIVYGRSFFSFTDDVNIAIKFKEKRKKEINNEQICGIFIIENPINKNFCNSCAFIKNYSYYKKESETLFFPFSCFEIINMKIVNENEFVITLNYLGKYADLFKGEDPMDLLEKIPEISLLALDVLNTRIFKPTIKTPKWFIDINKEMNQKKIEQVKNPFSFIHDKSNKKVQNQINHVNPNNPNHFNQNNQNLKNQNKFNLNNQKKENPCAVKYPNQINQNNNKNNNNKNTFNNKINQNNNQDNYNNKNNNNYNPHNQNYQNNNNFEAYIKNHQNQNNQFNPANNKNPKNYHKRYNSCDLNQINNNQNWYNQNQNINNNNPFPFNNKNMNIQKQQTFKNNNNSNNNINLNNNNKINKINNINSNNPQKKVNNNNNVNLNYHKSNSNKVNYPNNYNQFKNNAFKDNKFQPNKKKITNTYIFKKILKQSEEDLDSDIPEDEPISADEPISVDEPSIEDKDSLNSLDNSYDENISGENIDNNANQIVLELMKKQEVKMEVPTFDDVVLGEGDTKDTANIKISNNA